MRFLDVNSLYAPLGGGIRTYHHAKIDWFSRHPEHHYHFIRPGGQSGVERVTENVTVTTVPGMPIGRGYRQIVNYRPVSRVVRETAPDLVECGDPLLSVTFCRWLKRQGQFQGRLSMFWHSDLHDSWIVPMTRRGGITLPLRRALSGALARVLYPRQRFFDLAVGASPSVVERLTAWRYPHVLFAPLGVDKEFLEAGRNVVREPWRPENGPLPLLFAARLESDKGADVVYRALPGILSDGRFTVTIMGRGGLASAFAAVDHPRFKYLGFVSDRARVLEQFAQHRVLLSPGPSETFGLSALEAMSLGLIVVGTTVGGVGDMLKRMDSPFTFPAGDHLAFGKVVASLPGADLDAHAARARELAEDFGDWDKSISRLVGLYAQHAMGTTGGQPVGRGGPSSLSSRSPALAAFKHAA